MNEWLQMNTGPYLQSPTHTNIFLIKGRDLNPNDFLNFMVPKPFFSERHNYFILMATLILNGTIYVKAKFQTFILISFMLLTSIKSAGHTDLDPALHPTALHKGTSGAEKVNQNKTTTRETRPLTLSRASCLPPENRYFHRTCLPVIFWGRGRAAAVTSGWLKGCNPTY